MFGQGSGLPALQRPLEPFQGGQAVALDPVHLRRPVVEFTTEVVGAIAERVESRLREVDGVDRRQLLDQALTHPRHGRVGDVGWRLHFVNVAGGPFHHEERSSEHVAGFLEPQRPGNADRGVCQCTQDPELAREIVGFQQRGWFGPQTQHGVLAVVPIAVPGDDGQHHHLGRMSEAHPIEAFDTDVVGIGHLRAQPGRQTPVEIGVGRH